MNSYFVYWSTDWCRLLEKVGDFGPISVVFGGPHVSLPTLGKIRAGDIIYPISIKNNKLYLIARMEVGEIVDAGNYLNEHGFGSDEMWDSSYTRIIQDNPSLGHRIPKTCADQAAIAKSGTRMRFDFEVPMLVLEKLSFGPTKGKEKMLTITNGKLPSFQLQGHFRRLSLESNNLVETLMSSFNNDVLNTNQLNLF